MKKLLAAVLTAALTVGMLVGCGGSDSGDGGASKSGESSAKTAKVIDVDLTNEEYAFGVDKSQPELLEQVNAFIAKIQEDGTLDPRFHSIFQTEWTANIDYTWDKGSVNKYDKAANIEGQTVSLGETAIRFVMPQEEEYNKLVQEKHNSKYLIIDYKDVYNDNAKNVKMNYAYVNPSEGYPSDGSSENLFSHFYPSLTKHNSNNYYVADAGKKRNGNLNATFIMRSPEIYLIAAEADIYVNGGSNAMGYINKVRNRAGANPLTGNADIRTVLDERARELCGEYCRFYDLKRTGMLKDDSYLRDTHPDLAKYFSPDYSVRPIPSSFTQNLEGGGQYYQNKGY